MKDITITKEVWELLRELGATEDVRRNPDGSYIIQVDEEVFERLKEIDQNPSVALRRVMMGLVGRA
jgi:predicted CopG family antitoxin